jgi:formate-nitrite transporter family protein
MAEHKNEKPTRFSPAAEQEDLTGREIEAVEEESRPNATLIHEVIRAEGESELGRAASSLLLSGLAAGLSMGASLMVQGVLHARLPDAPWRELITSIGYTVGFVIVVLGRQQLFTENTLTPVLALLYRRDAATLWRMARLWSLVLAANLAATWAAAAMIAHSPVFEPDVHAAFKAISAKSIEHPFWTTAMKAVVAGWLIATMVWLLPGGGSSRLGVIVLITWVVGAAGLAHVVAGSVDAFYLVEQGDADLRDYLVKFLAPTLLGNIVGGVSLVAILNYGQVAAELKEPRDRAGS